MKKFLLLSFLFFFGLAIVSAQDIIFKKDGSKEEVKVTLVGEKEIQYKKFNNPDGPTYSVDKKDIVLITYANGEYEMIQPAANAEKPAKVDLTTDFAKNIIAYHMFDLVFGDFAVSYERLLNNGMVGFKVPVALGYYYYSDIGNFSNIIYSGLGVNFYPTGQGKWRYFMGPQVRLGIGKENDWIDYYDDYGNYQYTDEVENQGFYTQFFVDNGVTFLPVKHFGISVIASVGVRYFPEAAYNSDVLRPDGQFAVNISFRF